MISERQFYDEFERQFNAATYKLSQQVTECALCGETKPYYKPGECESCYTERHISLGE